MGVQLMDLQGGQSFGCWCAALYYCYPLFCAVITVVFTTAITALLTTSIT